MRRYNTPLDQYLQTHRCKECRGHLVMGSWEGEWKVRCASSRGEHVEFEPKPNYVVEYMEELYLARPPSETAHTDKEIEEGIEDIFGKRSER